MQDAIFTTRPILPRLATRFIQWTAGLGVRGEWLDESSLLIHYSRCNTTDLMGLALLLDVPTPASQIPFHEQVSLHIPGAGLVTFIAIRAQEDGDGMTQLLLESTGEPLPVMPTDCTPGPAAQYLAAIAPLVVCGR